MKGAIDVLLVFLVMLPGGMTYSAALFGVFGHAKSARYLGLATSFALIALGHLATSNKQAALPFVLLASIFLYLWWRNGGGKSMKKAARKFGEKSRARLQALVDRMTPEPVGSPA